MGIDAPPDMQSAAAQACSLDPDRRFGAWPDSVKALEQAETGHRVARDLRGLNLSGLVLTFGYLGFDASAGILSEGLAMRMSLMVPAYLLALFCCGAQPRLRNATSGLAVVVLAFVIAYLGVKAGQPHLDRYMMGVGVVVGFYIILTPLRAGHCLWVGAMSCLIVTLFVLMEEGATPSAGSIVLFTAMCCLGPLAVKLRHDRLRDRAFLLAVQSREANHRLLNANEELRLLSERDPLTGLSNRRGFESRFDAAYAAALETGGALTVMMIDLDHFKAFNDRYGHPMGDECIRRVGQTLARELERAGGFAARLGGEEFIGAIHGTSKAAAHTVAQSVVRKVARLRFDAPSLPAATTTVSIGVAVARATQLSGDGLVKLADRALYEAKNTGRNRVVIHAVGETIAA
ncbi:GGDEF domain-containing protein [Qipengyuania sp.]|uniref:GGDEF domain-containing protein n=1 Tax=Qipengyuania sp. TaxID=2004515 RepID=UPI0035C82428